MIPATISIPIRPSDLPELCGFGRPAISASTPLTNVQSAIPTGTIRVLRIPMYGCGWETTPITTVRIRNIRRMCSTNIPISSRSGSYGLRPVTTICIRRIPHCKPAPITTTSPCPKQAKWEAWPVVRKRIIPSITRTFTSFVWSPTVQPIVLRLVLWQLG